MATLWKLKRGIETGDKIRRSIWKNPDTYIVLDHHGQFVFNDGSEVRWSTAWIFAEDWVIYVHRINRG